MKGRNIFSMSLENKEQFVVKQDKFEMVSCPLKVRYCTNQVKEINRYYSDFDSYTRIKEYQNSIAALKNAFYKAAELKNSPCSRCAEFFQANIIQSLELTRNDIQRMTVGLFKTKRCNLSYAVAEDVLKELKKAAADFKENKKEKKMKCA